MNPRRLIVNADDFGRSASINAAVIRAHRERTAAQIVDALYLAVREFGRGIEQQDDVTAIVMKVL